MRVLVSLIKCVIILGGCAFLTRGFRFHGEYRAPKSQFQIALISQGFVKPEYDIAESAFAIVQFCPLPKAKGKSFQVSMISTPNEWIKVESQDLSLPATEWNWKTSEIVINDLLSRAGYSSVMTEEVKDIARAMENSLGGPKGFIMKGQGQSIEILRAKEYGYKVEESKAQNTWVNSSELSECRPS